VRRVLVDANVFVSFFIDRNAAQHAAARALIRSAEDGEIVAVVPQSVVFEVAYVLQSQYTVSGEHLATVVRGVTSFPGTELVDACPWKHLLEIWPAQLAGLGDAVIVVVATNTRCNDVATLDRKLAKKLERFGLQPYW